MATKSKRWHCDQQSYDEFNRNVLSEFSKNQVKAEPIFHGIKFPPFRFDYLPELKIDLEDALRTREYDLASIIKAASTSHSQYNYSKFYNPFSTSKTTINLVKSHKYPQKASKLLFSQLFLTDLPYSFIEIVLSLSLSKLIAVIQICFDLKVIKPVVIFIHFRQKRQCRIISKV